MSLSTGRLGTSVLVAGAFIRYGFYLAGALVLILVVLVPFLRWDPVKRVDKEPSFRLAASTLARMPMKTEVVSGNGAYVELRQYGQLHHRDKDISVVMVVPPPGQTSSRDLRSEMRDLGPLRAGAMVSNNYHDLQTRFGAFHAVEFRIDFDGRRKLCLAYVSRFDTSAVYLKGWYCEASGVTAGTWELACELDSLIVDRKLPSAEADDYLRSRMKKPAQCSASPVTQTTDTRTHIPRRRL